jgi:ribonuclease HI
MKHDVHLGTGISSEALIEKYLGLPTALGRSTDDQFEHIVTKIKKLAKGWTPKTLSSPGREILVKAVCQAIPTYSMSCFKLSKKMCKKIISCVARFWWGGDEKKRKIHWRRWDKLAIPKSSGGMGFRDFQLFNQAMLAKQGWRLMISPNSLCARVIKGKYFHNCDFMSATRKRNSSHIWNAILFGREALKRGLIKRVGDGTSIRVWDDPWIPNHIRKWPLVRSPDAQVNLVHELIDEDSASWDMEKIEENFEPVDADAIRRIPIGRFTEDIWAWEPEKNGCFTVRSCYKILSSDAQEVASESSSGEHGNNCWKILWKLAVPPKVKSFWWRVINEYVPCRQILKKRHMELIAFCKTCGADEESIFHALFECTWARLFWEELKKVVSIKVPVLHPNSWSTDLIEGKIIKQEEACVILCGCWAVWTERNALWHGEGGRGILRSVRWALETTYDLAQLGRMKKINTIKATPQWKKPDPGIYKINVDASFSTETLEGATGLVVRDSTGALIRAEARWIEFAANSLIMEACAIRDGICLAIDRGYQNVEVETDAQEVLKLIEDQGGGRSSIASIRQEIKELSGMFSSFKLLYVSRLANEAAHSCARKATRVRRRCLWINYNPPFLVDILYKDCNPAF